MHIPFLGQSVVADVRIPILLRRKCQRDLINLLLEETFEKGQRHSYHYNIDHP